MEESFQEIVTSILLGILGKSCCCSRKQARVSTSWYVCVPRMIANVRLTSGAVDQKSQLVLLTD